ncbi:MAG: hypothetical protein JJ979_12905 [Roseibium sp.]|nr:hypothetical protein [Roseibium sp.]
MAKKICENLREQYVAASHLTNDFIIPAFGSFDAFEEWRDSTDLDVDAWDRERNQRIKDDMVAGLIPEIEKGSASAVAQVRGLLGLNHPVGRPRGSGLNHDLIEKRDAAAKQELLNELNADIVRLSDL